MTEPVAAEQPRLERRLGLLQVTALNMTNMIGMGPFITIPLLMSTINGGGPQCMLGWAVALLITIPDGMVWAELGASMPRSGGSYIYLREGFGREKWGQMMAFLFIWQFMLSGPLEVSTAYIGFVQYLSFLWPGMTALQSNLVIVAVGLLTLFLLYRRISHVGTLSVALWVCMLLAIGAVVVTGALHFDPKVAFDFPPGAFHFSLGFLVGLGAAGRIGIFDYLGYFNVCHLGEEVQNPGKNIPRSILISLVAVALIYLAVNLSVIGIMPWREFVPATDPPAPVVSTLIERIHGSGAATVFTVLVLVTILASVFAILLSYSRIPYAAARDGCFFRVFARLHAEKHFPHLALLFMGGITIVCAFFPLGFVVEAALTTRIIVQFMGQIAAGMILRRRAPDMPRPYRMWLYPLPSLVALLGWFFVLATSGAKPLLVGLVSLGLGVIGFVIWSRFTGRWPFVMPALAGLEPVIAHTT
ncbi:MAG: APC family permease [Verrucomicrobiales bacterium]|nr:APC family permease [Verrucomicrobiales bacterium]